MRTLLLSLTLTLLINATSSAAITVNAGDTVRLTGGGGGTSSVGGAFNVYLNGPVDTEADFKTFCVEISQHIAVNGSPYQVTKIDTRTSSANQAPNVHTGSGHLTSKVAWLYTQFLNNESGFTNQDAVQYGIWLGMGYDASSITSILAGRWGSEAGPSILQAAINAQAGWNTTWDAIKATWIAANGTYGGVSIMQLGNAQDQLVPGIPNPGVTATPEPATLAIWGGLATFGLAAQAYRRKS